MATKNPRISVMLKPESEAILRRLSKVSRQSKSSIIAEFLEEACMPMFERMLMVLEAAATATDDAREATKQGFQDAEQKLLSVVGISNDLFNMAAAPVLGKPRKPSSRKKATNERHGRTDASAPARPEPGEPAPPPHVTRGSGTPNMSKCTCTTTAKERMEDPSCPVHMPPKASKRPSKPRIVKVKG
jgi:hypothetical protein